MLPYPRSSPPASRGGGFDLVEQCQTVELASLHPDVQEDQARHTVVDGRESTLAVESVRVSWPSSDRFPRRSARISSSSSTTRISSRHWYYPYPLNYLRPGLAGSGRTTRIIAPARRRSPAVRRAVPVAAVVLDDLLDDSEPRPVPYPASVMYGSRIRCRFSVGSPLPLSMTSTRTGRWYHRDGIG